MFSLQDLIASFAQETQIIKHLATKMPNSESGYDYKPNAYQRSMKELMYYMAMMGRTMTLVIRDGSYNPETIKEMSTEIYNRDLSEFDAMMDEQLIVVTDYLSSLTEDVLLEEINPFGQGAMSRKAMIFGMHHKNFTAYRMQFFCYLKDAGAYDLKTSNLRMGSD